MYTFICIGTEMRHPASTGESFQGPKHSKVILSIGSSCVALQFQQAYYLTREHALCFILSTGGPLCLNQSSVWLSASSFDSFCDQWCTFPKSCQCWGQSAPEQNSRNQSHKYTVMGKFLLVIWPLSFLSPAAGRLTVSQ